MRTSKFYKKLTQAEVGQTKTNEVYIRMPNDFDYITFFGGTHVENGSVIEVNFPITVQSIKDCSIKSEETSLRFVYFANSNREKRIPSLGHLFKRFGVVEGDVICLERSYEDANLKFGLKIYNDSQISISPASFLITSDIDDKPQSPPAAASGPLQVIYYGAPGTGKSFAIDGVAKDEVTVRTTFHPDSDYAGFVGAYKPTMQSLPMSYISEGIAKYAKAWNNHDGLERKIVYKYVPQAFLKAYVKAWGNIANFYETGEYHYLVIEEINRGNCAQIFGDLFQLLDRNNQGSSSYAIDADADIAQFLETDDEGFAKFTDEQRAAIREFVLVKDSGKELAIGEDILSGKKLLLPPNLRIWATMNTSDQSLFPIDSAFKRRWNWRYVPINYTEKEHWFMVGEKRYSWGEFLRKMNPIIAELTESPDKQMGFFFAKPDMKSDAKLKENDTISEEVFLNKVLFYLWTDVLKDFDMSDDKFINPDTHRAYEFSDFFDASKNYLQQFVDGVFA